jgi:hypothetical protein
VLIVPAGAVGWRANLHHLDTWWNTVAVHAEDSADDSLAGDSYSKKNQSLANAVCRFGNWAHYQFGGGPHDRGPQPDADGHRGLLMESPVVDRVLWVVRIVEACLLGWVCFRVGRRQDPLGDAAAFGLACASTLVISAIARGHYYMLLMPAVMFAGAWLVVQARPRWALAAVLVPSSLVLAHFAFFEITGRVGLLGIGTAVWFTALGISIVRLPAGGGHASDLVTRGVPRPAVLDRAARAQRRAHHSSTELSP